jgi:hypothetical protein
VQGAGAGGGAAAPAQPVDIHQESAGPR